MRPLFASVAAVAVMAATPALAASFNAWDMDDDGVIDRAEFNEMVNDADAFATFDLNGDDVLDAEEMIGVRYATMDLDGDGTLTVDEWDTWVDTRIGEQAVDFSVSDWDTDGDNIISRAEFADEVVNYDVFRPFAPGAPVAYDEAAFAEWLYEDQDLDDDLELSEDEFVIYHFGT